MITNMKQYEEAMDFDVDFENMSIEDIANLIVTVNMVYMDVMINCLDLKDRCRIMNSLTGVMMTIANIQMNMIVQSGGIETMHPIRWMRKQRQTTTKGIKMKIYTNDMAMMNMTPTGRIELTSKKDFDKFKPILSSVARALLSMTDLGCKEIDAVENRHPCQRRE